MIHKNMYKYSYSERSKCKDIMLLKDTQNRFQYLWHEEQRASGAFTGANIVYFNIRTPANFLIRVIYQSQQNLLFTFVNPNFSWALK